MSFFSKIAKSVLGSVAGNLPGGQFISGALALTGSPGGVNIANRLSKQVGCTIAQSNADQARALLAKGIDPCTGAAKAPTGVPDSAFRVPTLPPPTVKTSGPIGQIPSVAQPTFNLNFGGFDREAAGFGLPPGFPTPSLAVLKTPALPRRTDVSAFGAIPTSGMAAIGQIAGMAGRVGISAANKRKILRVVREVGIQGAAVALGLAVTDVAQVVANPPRRRRKGITGAQLANAKRVNRAVLCMANQLKSSCGAPTRRTVRRKTTCR
jgi:hypothetical protein